MQIRVLTTFSFLLLGAALATGCATNRETGAATGAVLGAVAGQAIGGDTGATLLGAAIGAGAGYAVGNERDRGEEAEAQARRDAQHQAELERARREGAEGSSVGEASTRTSPLANTSWKVASLQAAEPHEYVSKLVDFTATTVTTTTTMKDGKVETVRDNYKIVGEAIVIRRPNEVINAQFAIDGNMLVVNCNQFRAVLERR